MTPTRRTFLDTIGAPFAYTVQQHVTTGDVHALRWEGDAITGISDAFCQASQDTMTPTILPHVEYHPYQGNPAGLGPDGLTCWQPPTLRWNPLKPGTPEYLEHYGQDETGETTIIFRGSIEVDSAHQAHTYARTISFTTTHHVDPKYNTVRWSIEHPDRHGDALFTPDSRERAIEGLLSTIAHYAREQEGRIERSRS